jgi:hypothetical protein
MVELSQDTILIDVKFTTYFINEPPNKSQLCVRYGFDTCIYARWYRVSLDRLPTRAWLGIETVLIHEVALELIGRVG